MKPALYHLLIVALAGLAFCPVSKCLAQTSSPLEALAREAGRAAARRDAIRDTEQEAKALKAPTGLFGVKWLMSQTDVQRIRPNVKTVDGEPEVLVEAAQLYGRPASILYNFKGDVLLLIIVTFRDKASATTFAATHKELETEYGAMPLPSESENYLQDSFKIIERFAVRHTLGNPAGVTIEQIQLYRRGAKS